MRLEKAPPQEGVGQFLFVVRGDDDHGAVQGAHGLAGFVHMELHPVEFLQQVVGKLDVGLVDLVDQQHHLGGCGKGLPQLAAPDVIGHVVHPRIAQLAVAQPADGVILIKALLRLGGAFHMPFQDRQAEGRRHLPRKFRLSGAGFPLDQQRTLQRHGGIYRKPQIVGHHIVGS